jgi:hypothetical protein
MNLGRRRAAAYAVAVAALVSAFARGQEPADPPRPTRSAPPFGAAERTDPVERFRAACAGGDDAAAAEALAAALRAETSGEAATIALLRESLTVAETYGKIDAWLKAASAFADGTPGEAFPSYCTGWALQRQKRLARAEAYLARAVKLAPDVGDYRSAFAWNAFLRFDRDEAVHHAEGGSFADKERLFAAATATPDATPRPYVRAAALLAAYAALSALLLRAVRNQ